MNMYTSAEDAYLFLTNNNANPELLGYDGFYNRFKEQFNLLSRYGEVPVKLSVYDDSITLYREAFNPEATNGYYVGHNFVGQVKFLLDTQWGRTFLRIEDRGSSSYDISKTRNSVNSDFDVSNSYRVELYENSDKIGVANFCQNYNVHSVNWKPFVDFRTPDFSVGSIVHGNIPTMNDLYFVGDFNCFVQGRANAQIGVIDQNFFSRKRNEYMENFSKVALSTYEYDPFESLTEIAKYDKHKKLIFLHPDFSSEKEAVEYFQSNWEEKITSSHSFN